jgi:hypothetical protein
MRLSFFYGLLLVLAWGPQPAQSTIRIADDYGGRIGDYVNKYQGIRFSRETVMIDGLCASACTIVLGAVSHNQICVTSRAQLGFHSAYDRGINRVGSEVQVINTEATHMLYSLYPPPIKSWIARRGGLPSPNRLAILKGAELMQLYRKCPSTQVLHRE